MATVKTYQEFNVRNQASFGISKMQDIYIRRKGKPDEPHRHEYYTILIIKREKELIESISTHTK